MRSRWCSDRGRKHGNYRRKQAETGENRAANCRKLSEAVGDIKRCYFDDFGRIFDGSATILSGCCGGVLGWSKYVRWVSEHPFLVISVVFGVADCQGHKAPLFR